MRNPLLSIFRNASLFMRTITGTVLVTFTMLVLAPTAMAAQAANAQAAPSAPPASTDEEELSKTVLAVDEKVKRVQEKSARNESTAVEKEELKALRAKAESLDTNVMAHFADVEKHIKDKKLDPVILQRQQEAVTQYKQDMAAMLGNLKAAENAKDEAEFKQRVTETEKHLSSRKLKPAQQPFDPNNLPNQSLQPTQEKPKKSKAEFTRAGLHDTPYAKVAALGTFRYDTLAGASDPAYLAETVEVKMTQAVKDQAALLNHDPVQIYHWVLNNIDWIPTWGSMQDADHTLSSKRGNAMDIASLEIALLRASGIPARYVHGTLEIPEDRFRNWAGGFTSIEAALGFASSGGIPTAGVVAGGKITKVQMEHIWVEAAIDYFPSRGAINKEADAWVEMDPSFKQYQYLQGVDVPAITGIDGNALIQRFTASGTVNTVEGWVQGLDPTILQNAQTQAQTALQNHISQMTNPAVGDVIGGRKIILKQFPILPSALMNKIIVKGTRYDATPGALQNKVTIALGYDPYAQINGTTNEITYPLARVNNRKVTISFRPATPADEQVLMSFFPVAPTMDVPQITIPAYLVKVIPELRVEGQVVLTGTSAIPLGTGFELTYTCSTVAHGARGNTSVIPAGSFYSIGVAGGSVAPSRVQSVADTLAHTNALIAANDFAAAANITKDDYLGDMFYAGMLSWFSQYISFASLVAYQQGGLQELGPSIGIFGYEPKVNYLFASVPSSVSAGGVQMDLPGIKNVNAVSNGNKQELIGIRFQFGMLSSALEHSVPEQMFVTPDYPGEAVSAARLLDRAAKAGQRIYSINQNNQSVSLAAVHVDSATRSEIVSAISSGKQVLMHADPVSSSGWSGTGYIVFDPVSGDGAYKISGGMNGGGLFTAIKYLFNVFDLFTGFLAALMAQFPGGCHRIAMIIEQINAVIKVFKHLIAMIETGQCSQAALLAMSITAVAIGGMIYTEMVTMSSLGPLGGFVTDVVFDRIIDMGSNWAMNMPGCRT